MLNIALSVRERTTLIKEEKPWRIAGRIARISQEKKVPWLKESRRRTIYCIDTILLVTHSCLYNEQVKRD
jgi:hypothetical protein